MQEVHNISQSNNISTVGKILIYTTGGIAAGLSVVCLSFVSPAFRKICLPYVPATSDQLSVVARALSGRRGKLIDIGSGDGRIVKMAAKMGFDADGIEINPWLVYYSRISSYLTPACRNSKFYHGNLWKFNLEPYSNVVIFGVEQMMETLEKKLLEEAKNGTLIVACRFPLPNIKPVEIIGHGIDTVWKYIVIK